MGIGSRVAGGLFIAAVILSLLIWLGGCSGPEIAPPEPPVPPPAPAMAAPLHVDPAPVRRSYTAVAAQEKAAVLDQDATPEFIARVRQRDATARAALGGLEAPHGRTPGALARAKAAVGALQQVLAEGP